MTRIAIGIEYDGSQFHGWQVQPVLHTVQGVLERAITEIAGSPSAVVAAGRTDTGVHALEQIAHFDVNVMRPGQAWVRGVNSYLPASIVVRWAQEVPNEFHARFSAISRRYRYVLFNHPVRPALQSGRVGWYHRPLDAGKMNSAVQDLLGEQDFSSFRSSECQAKSPIKILHEARVHRQGDYVLFDFCAGGFLHHMVRNIVGSLLWVGYGKESPEFIAELLANRDRTVAAPTFMPDGLYFISAGYEARWQLPQQNRIMSAFDPVQF